jgi:large subunit ribosomal protein L6
MSRIGRRPVQIPPGVKVSLQDSQIVVEGTKGRLTYQLPEPIHVRIDTEGKKVMVECASRQKKDKALYGLTRALIANMVIGVTQGYEKRLEISGLGYNAKIQGKQIIFQLGFTHPVKVDIPEGLTVSCPSPTLIIVQGIDKQMVGQFAAEIRQLRPAEPYNLKGIKYQDEQIRRKAGKTFASGR